MSEEFIKKRSHPFIQKICQIRDRKIRDSVFVEGEKMVNELFKSPLTVQHLIISKEKKKPYKEHLLNAAQKNIPIFFVDKNVMAFISDTASPPGIISIADRPKKNSPLIFENDKKSHPLWVLLNGIQLPNNLGALMRIAEAVDATGIIQKKNGADPFGPKAIRASTGSVFRLPLFEGESVQSLINEFHRNKIHCVAADSKADMDYWDWDWTQGTALILGNEGQGFSKDPLPETVKKIKIPMRGKTESLNAATSAGIILYEAFRQRQKT